MFIESLYKIAGVAGKLRWKFAENLFVIFASKKNNPENVLQHQFKINFRYNKFLKFSEPDELFIWYEQNVIVWTQNLFLKFIIEHCMLVMFVVNYFSSEAVTKNNR